MEDDQGTLWIATYTGGMNKFDPATEESVRTQVMAGRRQGIRYPEVADRRS